MKKIGLIGYPLEHSFSNKYFSEKFLKEELSDYSHINYALEDISLLNKIIDENPDLIGFNVTIPYKKKIIPLLTNIDVLAKNIGSVNCVKIDRTDSKIVLKGYNTDVWGFEKSFKPLLTDNQKSALILGNGGSALAVKFVLRRLGISFQVVSRTKSHNTICYSDLDKDKINQNKIIINTTPLGMYPDINSCPDIEYSAITSEHLLYDLVYNPDETMFLKKGKDAGAIIKNGLEMLYLQADKSWDLLI